MSSKQLRIDSMYAYVAEDEEGEGITAMQTPSGGWIPMVGADMARMESLRPVAEATVKATGNRVKLVRFTTRVELEVLER